MHFVERGRPVTKFLSGAIPKRLAGLQFFLLFVLGVLLVSSHALAAPGAKAAGGHAAKAAASDYVGSETCATCHDDQAKRFANNPHQKITELHGAGTTCESCHGPGKAHVDGGGDVSKIFNPAKASPQHVDKTCLGCHSGTHPNFERSPHAKANVSCVSCHSVHHSQNTEHLLKASQPTLCFQCHTDVKPSFNMPFHHKVNEGVVNCTDCHNVHGTFQDNNLRTTADRNAICTRCHMDTRGPFVYEHAPVRAEGCMACHTPHGSQNARLLNQPNIIELCRQCHSPVAAATVHGMGGGSNNDTPCVNCHTMVHGSNLSQAFIR